MPEVTIGRTVLFHLGHDDTTKEPVFRPARVVHVWPDHHGVNLQVDLDGSNDAFVKIYAGGAGTVPDEVLAVRVAECERGSAWRTSVREGTAEGTWSWPPRAVRARFGVADLGPRGHGRRDLELAAAGGVAPMSTRVPIAGPVLIETGLLFELNRSTLHPVGFELRYDPDTEELDLHDCRAEKPAGIILPEELFKAESLALDDFMAGEARRLLHRWRLYGFVDQRVPGLNAATAGG